MQPRRRADRQREAAAVAAGPEAEEAIQREWAAQRLQREQQQVVERFQERETVIKDLEQALESKQGQGQVDLDLQRQLELQREALARDQETCNIQLPQPRAPTGPAAKKAGAEGPTLPPPSAFEPPVSAAPGAANGDGTLTSPPRPGPRAGLFGPAQPAADHLFGPPPDLQAHARVAAAGPAPGPFGPSDAGNAPPLPVAAMPSSAVPGNVPSNRENHLQLRKEEFLRRRQQAVKEARPAALPDAAQADAAPVRRPEVLSPPTQFHPQATQADPVPGQSAFRPEVAEWLSNQPQEAGVQRLPVTSSNAQPAQPRVPRFSSPRRDLDAQSPITASVDGPGGGALRPFQDGMPLSQENVPAHFRQELPAAQAPALQAPAGPPMELQNQPPLSPQRHRPGPPAFGAVPAGQEVDRSSALDAKRAYGEELRRQAEEDKMRRKGRQFSEKPQHIQRNPSTSPPRRPQPQSQWSASPSPQHAMQTAEHARHPADAKPPGHEELGGMFAGLGQDHARMQDRLQRQQQDEHRSFPQRQQEQQQQQVQSQWQHPLGGAGDAGFDGYPMGRPALPTAEPNQPVRSHVDASIGARPRDHVNSAAFPVPSQRAELGVGDPSGSAALAPDPFDHLAQGPDTGFGFGKIGRRLSDVKDGRRKQQEEMRRALEEQMAEKERQKKLEEQRLKELERREEERLRRDLEEEQKRAEAEKELRAQKARAVKEENANAASVTRADRKAPSLENLPGPVGNALPVGRRRRGLTTPTSSGPPQAEEGATPGPRPDLFGAPGVAPGPGPGLPPPFLAGPSAPAAHGDGSTESDLFGPAQVPAIAAAQPPPWAPGVHAPAPAAALPWQQGMPSNSPILGRNDAGGLNASPSDGAYHGIMQQQQDLNRQQQDAIARLQDEAQRLREEKDNAKEDLLQFRTKQIEEKEREVRKLQKQLKKQLLLQGGGSMAYDRIGTGYDRLASPESHHSQQTPIGSDGGQMTDMRPPGGFYSKYEDGGVQAVPRQTGDEHTQVVDQGAPESGGLLPHSGSLARPLAEELDASAGWSFAPVPWEQGPDPEHQNVPTAGDPGASDERLGDTLMDDSWGPPLQEGVTERLHDGAIELSAAKDGHPLGASASLCRTLACDSKLVNVGGATWRGGTLLRAVPRDDATRETLRTAEEENRDSDEGADQRFLPTDWDDMPRGQDNMHPNLASSTASAAPPRGLSALEAGVAAIREARGEVVAAPLLGLSSFLSDSVSELGAVGSHVAFAPSGETSSPRAVGIADVSESPGEGSSRRRGNPRAGSVPLEPEPVTHSAADDASRGLSSPGDAAGATNASWGNMLRRFGGRDQDRIWEPTAAVDHSGNGSLDAGLFSNSLDDPASTSRNCGLTKRVSKYLGRDAPGDDSVDVAACGDSLDTFRKVETGSHSGSNDALGSIDFAAIAAAEPENFEAFCTRLKQQKGDRIADNGGARPSPSRPPLLSGDLLQRAPNISSADSFANRVRAGSPVLRSAASGVLRTGSSEALGASRQSGASRPGSATSSGPTGSMPSLRELRQQRRSSGAASTDREGEPAALGVKHREAGGKSSARTDPGPLLPVAVGGDA